ncbi:hypothetical protein PLICRDRAFT_35084 [Plicaturopsis crispa FD-325 SS-3]|nr:hypothetical protein PLICRDRAFT_35084 [Plicaturopsis crispa FD-325 SS-3]
MPLAGLAIGIIAVIIALSLVAIPLLLCLVHVIGFGVIGPVAGSIAACIQGVVYGGATMGIFSVVQAFAMTTSVHPLGPILAIGLLVFVIWLIHQAGSGT